MVDNAENLNMLPSFGYDEEEYYIVSMTKKNIRKRKVVPCYLVILQSWFDVDRLKMKKMSIISSKDQGEDIRDLELWTVIFQKQKGDKKIEAILEKWNKH